MPIQGVPRQAKRTPSILTGVQAATPGDSGAILLGRVALPTETARFAQKQPLRLQQPESVSLLQANRSQELRLEIAGRIAVEGRRIGLPAAILSGQPAKGVNSPDPLAAWDPFAAEAPGPSTQAANKRSLPRNNPLEQPAFRPAAPRTARQSEWQPPQSQGIAPVWLADSPWSDRIILAWSRLTLAVKIADKSTLKLAQNELPSESAPESSPRFDFTMLSQHTFAATKAGQHWLAETGTQLHRSLQAVRDSALASLRPGSRAPLEATSPLAALRSLPSVAAVSNRLRLIPAASQGFSAAAHDFFWQNYRTALRANPWTAADPASAPQR